MIPVAETAGVEVQDGKVEEPSTVLPYQPVEVSPEITQYDTLESGFGDYEVPIAVPIRDNAVQNVQHEDERLKKFHDIGVEALCGSSLLTLLGAGLLVYGLGEEVQGMITAGGVLTGVCGLTYVLYVFTRAEIFRSRWFTEAEAEKLFTDMQNARPKLLQKMDGYHYRTVRRGSKTERKKVYTYRVRQNKNFSDFVDTSPRIDFDDHSVEGVWKIHVAKGWKAFDQATANSFRAQRNAVIRANKHRDRYYEYNEVYSLPGLPKTVFINRSTDKDSKEIPWYYNRCIYLSCSLFALAGCWLWFIRRKQKEIMYTSMKVLSSTEISAEAKENLFHRQLDNKQKLVV